MVCARVDRDGIHCVQVQAATPAGRIKGEAKMKELQAELVRLCGEVLDDGEITAEEILKIGQWFKDNPGAGKGWPGEILKTPVLAVCADDKVNKTELRKISRLLGEVSVEFSLRRQQQRLKMIRKEIQDKVNSVIASADLTQPRLPSIGVKMKIGSQTDKKTTYVVELAGPSCSCPDWQRRSGLPAGHLSRCCKHIIDGFNTLRPEKGYPGWMGAFFGANWRPEPGQEWGVLKVAGQLVLFSTAAQNGWGNVYQNVGDGYQRFGYSIVEDRWAYGAEPSGAAFLAGRILQASGGGMPGPGHQKESPGLGSFFKKIFS